MVFIIVSNCTKLKIQDAFLELITKNHLDHISVQKIIDKAGISRPTYYRYYYKQNEILHDIIDNFIKLLSLVAEHVGIPNVDPEHKHNILYSLYLYEELQCYYKHAGILRKIFKNAEAAEILKEKIYTHFVVSNERWLEKAMKEYPQLHKIDKSFYELHKRYSFSGNYDLIREWIITDCKEPIAVLIEFLIKMGSSNIYFYNNEKEQTIKFE